jgi:hypothetical protein
MSNILVGVQKTVMAVNGLVVLFQTVRLDGDIFMTDVTNFGVLGLANVHRRHQ